MDELLLEREQCRRDGLDALRLAAWGMLSLAELKFPGSALLATVDQLRADGTLDRWDEEFQLERLGAAA